MIRIGRGCKIFGMATLAIHRRAGVFVELLAPVASGAIGDRMYSDQGKTAGRVKIDYILIIIPVFW